jgi:hypothetical protein
MADEGQLVNWSLFDDVFSQNLDDLVDKELQEASVRFQEVCNCYARRKCQQKYHDLHDHRFDTHDIINIINT